MSGVVVYKRRCRCCESSRRPRRSEGAESGVDRRPEDQIRAVRRARRASFTFSAYSSSSAKLQELDTDKYCIGVM